jgi:hypothetical protein
VQHVQRQVVLAEVVAPLAHAVRLVDREQASRPRSCSESSWARKRGVVTRSGAAYSSTSRPLIISRSIVCVSSQRQRRVEEGRVHAGLLERADLVVHQRDQRADDDGDAAAARCRAIAGTW